MMKFIIVIHCLGLQTKYRFRIIYLREFYLRSFIQEIRGINQHHQIGIDQKMVFQMDRQPVDL